jgi:hypothetical protein
MIQITPEQATTKFCDARTGSEALASRRLMRRRLAGARVSVAEVTINSVAAAKE